MISPTTYAWAARGALIAVVIGILGALGAAVTGLTDWSDTYGSERRIGLNHALFNTTALILYLVSLVLRFLQGSGDSILAAVIGFVGLVSVLYAAYLISATCSHAGGPLDEGTLQGDVVECPWHGSRFCMPDGRVLTGPATVNAPRYDMHVHNGQVEVKRIGDH